MSAIRDQMDSFKSIPNIGSMASSSDSDGVITRAHRRRLDTDEQEAPTHWVPMNKKLIMIFLAGCANNMVIVYRNACYKDQWDPGCTTTRPNIFNLAFLGHSFSYFFM